MISRWPGTGYARRSVSDYGLELAASPYVLNWVGSAPADFMGQQQGSAPAPADLLGQQQGRHDSLLNVPYRFHI